MRNIVVWRRLAVRSARCGTIHYLKYIQIREMEMRKVLLAMLALFALNAVPMVAFADDEALPEVQAVDESDAALPPMSDAGDAK